MRKNIRRYYNLGCYNNYFYKAFKNKRGYLITNTYSMLKLKDIEGLEKNKNIEQLDNIFNDLSSYVECTLNVEDIIDLKNLKTLKKHIEDVDLIKDKDRTGAYRTFGVRLEALENIYRIIKPTSVKVLKKEKYDIKQFVIELKNEKTKEIGYLLPTLRYE